MRLFFILLLLSSQCVTASDTIFSTNSETEPKNKISPPSGLIKFILNGEDANDNRLINECIEDKGLNKKEKGKLFSVYKIDLNGDGQPDYFVRPSLNPYCNAFYGAHLFRYWLITRHTRNGKSFYRLVFKNGGDGVSILASKTNNYHDLLIAGHNAVVEFIVMLSFNGKEYEEKGCVKNTFTEEGVKAGTCDSE